MFSKDAGEKADDSLREDLPDKGGVDQPMVSEGQSQNGLPDIRESQIYLVEEGRPDISYRLLVRALTDGRPGLCVTRVYPEILKQRFDLEKCAILWLSTAGQDEAIRPRDLERLSLLLEQFLKNDRGVVLVDGIEYLITNNDFVTVLRLIQSIRDLVAMNQAIMIISLSPSTLGYQELNLLEREMDSVFRFHLPENTSQQDFHGR
ncbi:MAG: DUF835 domain-containing protein [Thermoplasmata archaeon]|nr:DUF835 domain-containing protein [Thermoplasmata archaeon]